MKRIIIKTANEEIFKAFNDELLTPLKKDLKDNPENGYIKEDDNEVLITITKLPED